jgi:hypothetical protein
MDVPGQAWIIVARRPSFPRACAVQGRPCASERKVFAPFHGGNRGSNPLGDANLFMASNRTTFGYPKTFPTLCSWTRLVIGRWSIPPPPRILRFHEARRARFRASSRDENPTEEHLIFGVYTQAEWDTICTFANTSDGKIHLLRRLNLACTSLRLASRGLPPPEYGSLAHHHKRRNDGPISLRWRLVCAVGLTPKGPRGCPFLAT